MATRLVFAVCTLPCAIHDKVFYWTAARDGPDSDGGVEQTGRRYWVRTGSGCATPTAPNPSYHLPRPTSWTYSPAVRLDLDCQMAGLISPARASLARAFPAIRTGPNSSQRILALWFSFWTVNLKAHVDSLASTKRIGHPH